MGRLHGLVEDVAQSHGASAGLSWRRFRVEAQHLVNRPLPCHKIGSDQLRARMIQSRRLHVQLICKRLVTVIAESLAVADADQKQVQGHGAMAQSFDMPVTDQAVIDPAEAFGHFAQPLW
jgi:hypothetical protein